MQGLQERKLDKVANQKHQCSCTLFKKKVTMRLEYAANI